MMSYDPYSAYSPDVPPPAVPTSDVRGRVLAPAIFLIVVGILNLFLAAWPAIEAFQLLTVPLEELEVQMKKQNPKQWEQMQDLEKQGYSLEMLVRWMRIFFSAWAAVDFLASFLVILGGVRMLALKNYGLAVLAAILAALLFVSCSGCCGLGAIAGIWALIVLINPEVKAAFQ